MASTQFDLEFGYDFILLYTTFLNLLVDINSYFKLKIEMSDNPISREYSWPDVFIY